MGGRRGAGRSYADPGAVIQKHTQRASGGRNQPPLPFLLKNIFKVKARLFYSTGTPIFVKPTQLRRVPAFRLANGAPPKNIGCAGLGIVKRDVKKLSGPFSIHNWQTWFSDWTYFADGFLRTLYISLLGLVFTLVIGLLIGILLCGRNRVVLSLCKGYMSFFQNTPLVIQVFIYYNVLPKLGIRLGVVAIGVLGLALYTGAYAADIVHSAIKAVPIGQMEAAYSQGFNYLQAMYHIILPQAIKIGLPPMTNQAVNLIKNSSVLAVIAGGELMYRADSWSGSNLIYGPTFVMTGVLYLIICLPISLLARWMEKRSVRNV